MIFLTILEKLRFVYVVDSEGYVALCFEKVNIDREEYRDSYSKTCVKWPLSKRQKIGYQDQLSLNAGQKYCRLLQEEHSAILLTFIKLPFEIKIVVLSIFEWPIYTYFIVCNIFGNT